MFKTTGTTCNKKRETMRSRHHLEVATWNRGWNEETGGNKELRSRPEEGNEHQKRSRHRSRLKFETCEGRRLQTRSRPEKGSYNLELRQLK